MPVFSVRLQDRKPVAGTLKCLSSPYCRQAMVTRDGECAVFWNALSKYEPSSVWRAKTDGTDLTKLTPGFRFAGMPFWTPDERHIVFCGSRDLPEGLRSLKAGLDGKVHAAVNLHIMDKDGKDIRRLTSGDYLDLRPCVSPDGQTVVFVSNRLGLNTLQLWKLDLSSGDIELIDDHDGVNYRPIFSNDGKYLAYQSTKHQQHRENLLIREWPDGKEWNPISLREHEWIHGAFWLRDDKHLLVHGNLLGFEPTALFIVELSSGRHERIEIPGLPRHAHGTVDQEETVLVFDSSPTRSFRLFLSRLMSVLRSRLSS